MERKAAQSGAESQSEKPRIRRRLPRVARLRRGPDFARIYRQGVRVRGSSILLIATAGQHPSSPRMGLSVGRKFNKKAVARNRVRRVLRESFRLARPELPHLDLILIPTARDHRYRTPVCRQELFALAAKAHAKWLQRHPEAAP